MKILLPTGIYPPDIGGPATYVPKIATRMMDDGYTPIVITYSDTKGVLQDDEKFSIYRVVRTPIFLINYIKYWMQVIIHGRTVNGIYLQDYFSAGIPTIIANLLLRKPLITKVVGIFSWEQSQSRGFTEDTLDDYVSRKQIFILEIVKKIECWLIKQSHEVIVPSEYMKGILIQLGVDASKISVIYNSFEYIEYKKINPLKKKEVLGVSGKKIYISVGRLVRWKNFEKLIKEFDSNLGYLYVIGDGPMRTILENLIRKYNKSGYISITGSLSKTEVYEYYQIADFFILISSYEGMSHTLIEAMSMGLYIISSDITANRETLDKYPRKAFVSLSKKIEFDEIYNDNTLPYTNPDTYIGTFDFEHLYTLLIKRLNQTFNAG